MPRNKNFSLNGDNYNKEVLFKGNPLGVTFNLESNGYYYAFFDGNANGGLDSWVLVDIADMLDELNAPLVKNYNKYLKHLDDNNIDRDSDIELTDIPF